MPPHETFETMLTGGHPNSVGRTLEVVEAVLRAPDRMEELYQCYFSPDAVVRLRVSNAFKRLWRADTALVVPFIDRMLTDISDMEQASAQWTLAQLFHELDTHLSDTQRAQAMVMLQRNLEHSTDWIVLNNTMQTLGTWAGEDAVLKDWLRPHLERLRDDPRQSVANKAHTFHTSLYAE